VKFNPRPPCQGSLQLGHRVISAESFIRSAVEAASAV
jgi:hypothetical protein